MPDMPSLTVLNTLSKVGCIREIRLALIADGNANPKAADIYEMYKTTKHASGTEKNDRVYISTQVSNIRKKEREMEGKAEDEEGSTSTNGRRGRPKQMPKPPQAQVSQVSQPAPVGDVQLETQITMVHIREVKAMVPEGVDMGKFASYVKEIDRVAQMVGGVGKVRHILAFLLSSAK